MSHDFSKYPAAQRAAYLGAIAALVTADRQATEAEGQFLSALAEQTGLSAAEAQRVVDAAMDPNSGSLKQNLDVLKNSELRFSLMHDLVAFAQADGDYNEAEQERVASMAKYLGITEEQQEAVDQYQTAAAQGEDPSALNGLLGSLGMPKGGGALAGLLATVGPMILQQIMARRGGAPAGGLPASSGGGLGDILGQVMGAMGGGSAPAGGSAGGLGGILGQVMGAMGGGGSAPARGGAPAGSGMGGLGQILSVLGQMQGGGGGNAQPAPRGGGGYEAVSGVLGRLFGGR
ncbi:MAG: TerB family tellurite resistance protein [Verrucomicrobia bacterium]|nr:TerB family tellurite resistance protein [Verrucomicrobiota bacterium]